MLSLLIDDDVIGDCTLVSDDGVLIPNGSRFKLRLKFYKYAK